MGGATLADGGGATTFVALEATGAAAAWPPLKTLAPMTTPKPRLDGSPMASARMRRFVALQPPFFATGSGAVSKVRPRYYKRARRGPALRGDASRGDGPLSAPRGGACRSRVH